MSMSDLIQSMADAGAPMEAILIAVRALEARDNADADRRAKAAERKRLERARRDGHATVTGQSQTKKEIPPTPPKEKNNNISITREAEFSEFWAAYPRKVAKPGALKAFRKARDKADMAEIMAGLGRYQSQKPEYADWRHPATWLNDEGWADDYGPPQSKPPGNRSKPNTGQDAMIDALRNFSNEADCQDDEQTFDGCTIEGTASRKADERGSRRYSGSDFHSISDFG